MAQARFFSSTAQPTTLTANISSSTTSIPVAATTGFPLGFPFTIALDYGTSLEELADVTSMAGLNMNVTRAVDGTSASTHSAGAVVRHVSSARDFNLLYLHVGSTSGVHGVTGNVVGDTDTQTLTNKTLNSPTVTGTISGTAVFASTGAGVTPLTLEGFSGQTADLFDIKNSALATLFAVSGTGRVSVTPTLSSFAAFTVSAASGMTADLADFQVNGVTQASISAGGVITANGLVVSSGVGQKLYAIKAANTDRLSGTATADPDFTFSLPAAGTYQFEASMGIFSTGANALTGQFICSTATSGSYTASLINSSGQSGITFLSVETGLGSQTFTTYAPGTANSNGCTIRGQLTISGAGTFALYWSGTSASATTDLTTGSLMTVTRIA